MLNEQVQKSMISAEKLCTSKNDLVRFPQPDEISRRFLQEYSHIKGPYADYILIPRVQPEAVNFWCQMKAHIFLIITPKFQPQRKL